MWMHSTEYNVIQQENIMKKLILSVFVIPILFINYSCGDNPTSPNDRDTSVVAYKPNIYIYPNQELTLSVKLVFPNGGRILESIPDYQDSWNVTIKPNGKIDDTYDYLFYECRIPDLTQKKYGWIIKRTDLRKFFNENLAKSNFNQKEINDFVEYWGPKLTNYEYYEIYPQYKLTVNEMVKVNFSIKPENFFRLFYLIKGRNNNQKEILEPIIEIAKRENYFAIEWGVILK